MSGLSQDANELIKILHGYTGIAEKRLTDYIKDYGVSNISENANMLCKTDAQREKLQELFNFKRKYELVNALGTKLVQITSVDIAKKYFKAHFANNNEREHFAVAFLNSTNVLIAVKDMTVGTINETMIYPREFVKEALFHNATSVILAHNHPGGSMEPSPSDIDMTNKLVKALKVVSIGVMDHIIVARDKTASFAEKGFALLGSDVANGVIKERNRLKENDRREFIRPKAPNAGKTKRMSPNLEL